MIVDVAGLDAAQKRDFSFVVTAADIDAIHADYSFEGPITVCGFVTDVGSSYRLQGVVACDKSFICDRCLGHFVEKQKHSFSEDFQRKDEDGEEDAAVNYFSGDAIDIADLVRDTVLAAQPLNNICRPDCRGLCPQCGADLNLGDCGCDRLVIDPRLAALQQLLKKK